ncbi:hypothetical protein BHM03_00055412 [Ensete ventricosum]|nr:hypothetical protein BHM03_00055412 [Ensete ventricosum]
MKPRFNNPRGLLRHVTNPSASQSPSMPSYDLLVQSGEREGEEEEEEEEANDTNPHCAVGEGRVLGDAHPRADLALLSRNLVTKEVAVAHGATRDGDDDPAAAGCRVVGGAPEGPARHAPRLGWLLQPRTHDALIRRHGRHVRVPPRWKTSLSPPSLPHTTSYAVGVRSAVQGRWAERAALDRRSRREASRVSLIGFPRADGLLAKGFWALRSGGRRIEPAMASQPDSRQRRSAQVSSKPANSPTSSTTSSSRQVLEASVDGQSSPASSSVRDKPQYFCGDSEAFDMEGSKESVTVTVRFRPLRLGSALFAFSSLHIAWRCSNSA